MAQPVVWAAAKQPSGMCYRVLMWVADALDDAVLSSWQQERAALLARMREAGIKGSRGLLAQLEGELDALNERAVKAPLATCVHGAFSPARVRELADALRGDAAVLSFRVGTASAEVLAELSGEEGVDAMAERWQRACPELRWHPVPLVEALKPLEAAAWQQACYNPEAEAMAAEAAEEAAAGQPFCHQTVLLTEAVEALQPAPGKVFVDATLGGGGHSERLLQAGAEVWAIDQDPAARAAAKARLAAYGDHLHVLAGNFRNVAELLKNHGVGTVDGLLADIGISSPQVDCASRGFSFLNEGPLDMRMNPAAERTAADIVNHAPEEELAHILWQYGEERASRAIARRIVQERAKAPLATTTQLAGLIASVMPRKGKLHPATRSFQALRIAVNDELGALDALLQNGLALLKSGGRFAIITFHSLEDRAVKHFFERVTRPEIDRPEWPQPRPNPDYAARLVYRKPLTPGEAELAANPRSRSAKLRVIEKI